MGYWIDPHAQATLSLTGYVIEFYGPGGDSLIFGYSIKHSRPLTNASRYMLPYFKITQRLTLRSFVSFPRRIHIPVIENDPY